MQSDWIRVDDEGFIASVGPIFHLPFKDGIGQFRFAAEARHRNRNGIVHGGMLMTFADVALGLTALYNSARQQATAQLDVHFIRPVRIGDWVEMECRVIRATRSLMFVDGNMSVSEQVVATARGIWKLIGAEP